MDHDLELSESFLTEIDRVRRRRNNVSRDMRIRKHRNGLFVDMLGLNRPKSAVCNPSGTERTAFEPTKQR